VKAGEALRSNAIIERGYSKIPTILLWGQAKLGLTPEELNVLLQLISHRWYVGNDPHPSKDAIAGRMRKHPRTVQSYLTRLEQKGLIRRIERSGQTRGKMPTDMILPASLKNSTR